MKKLLITTTLITLILTSLSSWACDENGDSGWAPANDRYISTVMTRFSNISEAQFNHVLDRIEDFATTQVSEAGGNLVIKRNWDDGTVNASADRSDGNYNVNMYGGLARHPLMSPEGFAMVACHELGHHIGGAPKKKIFFFTLWASNEGQSDYYASAKCMRRYFELDNNRSIADTLELPDSVIDSCANAFTDDNERAICERMAAAGQDLANVLYELGANGETDFPEFETPDTSVVSSTNHNHPAAQCRLDTYLQGALCPISEFDNPSETNPRTGYCNRSDNYQEGTRPLCWYKP